ncbi:MAG: porin [Gammaproteobacteria bacterium]|nr:porin [Gammaproteobacteria bacterium]
MNFKKTAVASAVGATLAISGVASSVAYADGHSVQLYGRVNNVIKLQDKDYTDAAKAAAAAGGPLGTDDESSTNVSTIGSRVGIKASAPINESTTAHARFEWSASTVDETGAFGDTRIGEIGVTGDFGTVKAGNMWSTFYNVVGTHMDPTVTVGAVLYSTGTLLPYRVSNAIQYSNSFGAVNVSAEIRLSDEDDPDEAPGAATEKIGGSDGNALGVSFMATENLLLAVAVDQSDGVVGDGVPPATVAPDDDEDVDRVGWAAKWSQDNWWASLSWGETDVDGDSIAQTQIHVGADFGNQLTAWLGYGEHDIDISGASGIEEPTAVTLNVTKRIGNSGFRVYYEGIMMSDGDDVYTYDQDWHNIGMRIDF